MIICIELSNRMEEYVNFIITKAFQTSDFTQRIAYIKDIQVQINQYVENHKELDFMAKVYVDEDDNDVDDR